MEPHNHELEKCFLNYLTMEPTFIKAAIESGMSEKTFHSQAHKTIWKAVESIHTDGLTLDELLLKNRLGGWSNLSDPLKNAFLGMLACGSIGACPKDWLYSLRCLEAQRTLLMAWRGIQGEMEAGGPVSSISEKLKESLREFETATSRSKARTVADQLRESLTFIQSLQAGEGGAIIPWGIPGMDALVKMQRGQIFTLAAPCGTGKTRFIINDLLGKIRLGCPCSLFSYENSSNALYLGIKSILSGLPEDTLTSPGGIRDMEMLKGAFQFLSDKKGLFRIFGKGDYRHTPGGIASELRRLHDGGFKPDMVYIDYLQNMNLGTRITNRTEELEKIVFELAELTSEFDAALVILSQLNRDKNREQSKRRPGVADLKGSSALEQVSDYIFFLSNAEPARRGVFPLDFYSVKMRSSRGFVQEQITFDASTGAMPGIAEKHRYTKSDRPDRRAA